MHFRISFLLMGLVFMLCTSCASIQKASPVPNFVGHVYERKFNNMPMSDKPSSKGSPLGTTVYVYEATSLNQLNGGAFLHQQSLASSIQSNAVDSVISDQLGAFQFNLKPGKYSVFVKYNSNYYIPFFSGVNWVSIIEIKANEVNKMDIVVNGSESVE
jgi:hypothetical protein